MKMSSTKDLTGKLAVITGANSGIGLEACVDLASRGCEIVMCCRNEKKAETAKHQVVTRSGSDVNKIHICQLDLADLDNIGTFRSRYELLPGLATRPVDMLILNAGVMALSNRELTQQGLEAQTGTNVVGHFKFAAVMFDLCKKASNSRVVSVSSMMHRAASGVNLDDFNREKKYNAWSVYEQTKLCNLLFMAKLNRLLEEKGVNNVIVVGCHPGYTATNLQQHTPMRIFNIFAQSGSMGAKPTVLAATDPQAKRNGYAGPSYLFEVRGPAKWGCRINKVVFNTDLQDKLWDKLESLTSVDFISKI